MNVKELNEDYKRIISIYKKCELIDKKICCDDIQELESLLEIYGIQASNNIRVKKKDINSIILEENKHLSSIRNFYDVNKRFFYDLALRNLKIISYNDFYPDIELGKEDINEKDIENIVLEFYLKQGKYYYDIVKDIINKKHIINNKDAYYNGETKILYMLDKSYIIINGNLSNTFKMISLVHEIGHIIQYEQIKDLGYRQSYNLNYSPFIEFESCCQEYHFSKFLEDNNMNQTSYYLKNQFYNNYTINSLLSYFISKLATINEDFSTSFSKKDMEKEIKRITNDSDIINTLGEKWCAFYAYNYMLNMGISMELNNNFGDDNDIFNSIIKDIIINHNKMSINDILKLCGSSKEEILAGNVFRNNLQKVIKKSS